MAANNTAAGSKRKAVLGVKKKLDGGNKRVRFNGDSLVEENTQDFEDFSGSNDGRVHIITRDSIGTRQNESDKTTSGKAFESGQTSRESHAKQKQLAHERKAAKPLADEVQRTKKIWERLRLKSHVPKDERQKLVAELYNIITGHIRDFVLKHDAVRAIQTAIKYSTPEQRKQIAKELEGTYAQLAEGRYAKFLIGKLLVHNDNEIRDIIIPNFYGRVRKLINHAEASWILDDIYRTVASTEQRAKLLREWYGPEFSLKEMTKDAKPTADLKQILVDEPSKRGPIMNSLLDLINSLIQKKMTGFTMLHDAMLQYFLNTQPGTEEFAEFIELIKGDETGDLLKNLAFTRSGARLVCLLLAYGTAKDRKVLLRGYKDTMTLLSGDQYGHMIILVAYDVLDDTKLTAKAIFPELLGEKKEEVGSNVVAAANNPYARITLLYLFEGLSKSLFPASHSLDLAVMEEVHEIRKTTSKKDSEVRRKELVAVLSPPLIDAIAVCSSDLTSTAFGCQFVAEVLLSAIGSKQEALEAIALSAKGDPTLGTAKDEIAARQHMSCTPFGGRLLKSLIQGGRYDKAAGKILQIVPSLGFSNILYPLIEDHVVNWATGPSSFVILALVEAVDFNHSDGLKKILRTNKKLLQKAASEQTPEQRVAKESRTENKSMKRGKKKAGPTVGNPGSNLLLQRI